MTSEWYKEFNDGDDDDDEIEETMEKLPHLNQLSHAYASIMLLKEKLNGNVYTSCKELLQETTECMDYLKRLRVQLLFYQEHEIFFAELAHLQAETSKAIMRYAQDRSHNPVWLRSFKPKDGTEFKKVLDQFKLSNELLLRSGFSLSAVEVMSDQIEAHVNQSFAFKPAIKIMTGEDQEAENDAIDKSFDTL